MQDECVLHNITTNYFLDLNYASLKKSQSWLWLARLFAGYNWSCRTAWICIVTATITSLLLRFLLPECPPLSTRCQLGILCRGQDSGIIALAATSGSSVVLTEFAPWPNAPAPSFRNQPETTRMFTAHELFRLTSIEAWPSVFTGRLLCNLKFP
jgi:hypothetical protein